MPRNLRTRIDRAARTFSERYGTDGQAEPYPFIPASEDDGRERLYDRSPRRLSALAELDRIEEKILNRHAP